LLLAATVAGAAPDTRGESIDVVVHGTLKAGVMAIGAETTGVTVTANGIVWELELNGKQLEEAGNLHGRKVVVAGRLAPREGVELRNRLVVKVRSLKASR
jgi:hypothetical protein